MRRFLILGSESPTYYASAKDITKENVSNIKQMVEDTFVGIKAVDLIVEISHGGRAPKNDAALFALALAASSKCETVRSYALSKLKDVARTGTHVLHFCNYISDLRGWGRGLKKAVASWFNDRKPENLVNQILKYRQRDGWSMRDVLRVSHPRQFAKLTPQQEAVYHYVTKGWEDIGDKPHPDPVLKGIWAFERAKKATSATEVAKLVRDYKLPWECVDTKWLNDHVVWDALLENIKPEALMRNLGRLSANGFIKEFSTPTREIVSRLTDEEALKSSRLHPFKLLVALKIYEQGHGEKGSLRWSPNQRIVNALDEAFYLAHKNVEPCGKNFLVAVDVSGSMSMSNIAGMPLTPRVASMAVAMSIAKIEPEHKIVAISGGLTEVSIGPRQRLDDIIKATDRLPFDRTDLSLPMIYATKNKLPIDGFITITDNEVNSGVHPSLALEEYRQKMCRNAKSVVIAMTSTGFTIADPNDVDSNGHSRQLDIAGMDVSVPELVSDFVGNRF
jgi:60 kDa SS-A/Ro ribonucleoprotein